MNMVWNNLIISIIGSLIGAFIAIYFVYELNYILDYRKHKIYLIREIESNYQALTKFPELLNDVANKYWKKGINHWIDKSVTTRIEVNEVYHYLTDKAYFGFISKAFELNLSETTLQVLCPLYFYGKKFSEDEQSHEARMNKIMQHQIDFEGVAEAAKIQMLAQYSEYRKEIEKYYFLLKKEGNIILNPSNDASIGIRIYMALSSKWAEFDRRFKLLLLGTVISIFIAAVFIGSLEYSGVGFFVSKDIIPQYLVVTTAVIAVIIAIFAIIPAILIGNEKISQEIKDEYKKTLKFWKSLIGFPVVTLILCL